MTRHYVSYFLNDVLSVSYHLHWLCKRSVFANRHHISTLLLEEGFFFLQFSAPLRSPFPLSGWTRAVHAGTCSPCSSLLGAGSASVCAFEYYNSHTGGPSISPFLPPDQSLWATARLVLTKPPPTTTTITDFRTQKSSIFSEFLPTGLKSFPLDAPTASLMWLQPVGVCLHCLTSLYGSLISFGNYSVDRDIGSGLCYVLTPWIPDWFAMGRMQYPIGDISPRWHTACP